EEQQGDGEGKRHQLEGRHLRRRRGEERQRRPEQHGDPADEGGSEARGGGHFERPSVVPARRCRKTSKAASTSAGLAKSPASAAAKPRWISFICQARAEASRSGCFLGAGIGHVDGAFCAMVGQFTIGV